MEEQEASRAVTRAVQATALHDKAMPRRGSQGDVVLSIVRRAYHQGQRDLTRREIQRLWEAMDEVGGVSVRRDAGLVSRVVNDLLKRQALKTMAETRVCTVSGQRVTTVGLICA